MSGWGPADDDAPPGSASYVEADNGLRQFERLAELVADTLAGSALTYSAELICELNLLAVRGLVESAGSFRDGPVTIGPAAKHVPPDYQCVPRLVEELVAILNDPSSIWPAMAADDALELAAYALWRVNWIHPFADGNGRTARAIAHLVLAHRTGVELHWVGEAVDRKGAYYNGLVAADLGWSKHGTRALQNLTQFIRGCIERTERRGLGR